MSEQIVFTGKAVVYYFDSAKKSWAPSNVAAFSRLDIYRNTATGGYRVIGRGADDTSVISINSQLSKDTVYTRTRETFHQFQDPRYLYGLNFVNITEAEGFAVEFDKAVNSLKGGGGGAAPPPAAAPKPSPAAKPPAPAAPTATPSPRPPAPSAGPPAPSGGPPPAPAKPPPPPKAPPKAAPRTDAPEGRGALLDSIQGFSANKLKKTETVDKSGPVLAAPKPAAPTGDSEPAAGGAKAPMTKSPSVGGGGDMMASILAKRAAMKEKQSAAPAPAAAAASQPPPSEPKKAPVKSNTLTRAESNSVKPPAPSPRVHKPAAAETPSQPSSSHLPEDLKTLKEEIMADVRAELAQLKQELLNAISGNQ